MKAVSKFGFPTIHLLHTRLETLLYNSLTQVRPLMKCIGLLGLVILASCDQQDVAIGPDLQWDENAEGANAAILFDAEHTQAVSDIGEPAIIDFSASCHVEFSAVEQTIGPDTMYLIQGLGEGQAPLLGNFTTVITLTVDPTNGNAAGTLRYIWESGNQFLEFHLGGEFSVWDMAEYSELPVEVDAGMGSWSTASGTGSSLFVGNMVREMQGAGTYSEWVSTTAILEIL